MSNTPLKINRLIYEGSPINTDEQKKSCLNLNIINDIANKLNNNITQIITSSVVNDVEPILSGALSGSLSCIKKYILCGIKTEINNSLSGITNEISNVLSGSLIGALNDTPTDITNILSGALNDTPTDIINILNNALSGSCCGANNVLSGSLSGVNNELLSGSLSGVNNESLSAMLNNAINEITSGIINDITTNEYRYYGRAEDFNDIANKINEIIDKLKHLPEIPEKTSQLINDSGFITSDTFDSNFSKLSELLSDTRISGIIQPYIIDFQTSLSSYLPLCGGVIRGDGSIGFEATSGIYDLRHIHPRDLHANTLSGIEYYTTAGLKLKEDNFQVDLNISGETISEKIQHTVSGPTLSLNSLNNTQSFYVSGTSLSGNHFGIWRIQ